jgi:hypothetical protein
MSFSGKGLENTALRCLKSVVTDRLGSKMSKRRHFPCLMASGCIGSASEFRVPGLHYSRIAPLKDVVSYMDSQIIELIGRQYLIAELFRADLEVALPVRDRGVDLIAYRERSDEDFQSIPIQVKASSVRGWGVNRKYERTKDLLLVHVWNVAKPEHLELFGMTYQESLEIADAMGYLKTDSWTKHGAYSTTNPSAKLRTKMDRYRMSEAVWKLRLAALPSRSS